MKIEECEIEECEIEECKIEESGFHSIHSSPLLYNVIVPLTDINGQHSTEVYLPQSLLY